MPTRAEYAKIHIAKKELGLDDETYRDILAWKFKVTSSKELNSRQVGALLAHFRAKGWKPRARKRSGRSNITANDDQSRKIRALWITMHKAGLVKNPSELALARYVKRMTTRRGHPGTDRLEWCSAAEKRHLIEVLKKWQIRDLTGHWLVRYWLVDGRLLPYENERRLITWRTSTS